jgi:anaerobic selenocysteine-containing dehydrogenase
VKDGGAIRIHNGRGHMHARARVTEKIPAGVVWMHDGWAGLNDLTSGTPVVADAAVDAFHALGFSGGQAAFDARVEVEAV